MNIIEENKQVYDAIADQFSSTRQYLWGDLEPLAEYAQKGDTILDLGCGNGRLYQLFEKHDLSVTYIGQDQSDGLLGHAAETFPNGQFVSGSMTQIPLSDKTVDSVYSIAAFHHLPDDGSREACLKEIARVLRPGGTLVMSNWNLENDYVVQKIIDGKYKQSEIDPTHVQIPWRTGDQTVHGWRHYYYISHDMLKTLLEPLGFSVKKEYYTSEQVPIATAKDGLNMITIATYETHD
jgi:ubiquinone/menaquinone biosynthesis C-methylase UbiE